MNYYSEFVNAIEKKKMVKIRVNSKEKGQIERICIPFDYGPSKRYGDGKDRYHFYDLDSPDGSHNLSILPDQLEYLEMVDKSFNPGDYVTWEPNWYIKRDWGAFS